MDIKNLKNLNTPKYRVSIASVVFIGGGIIFFGLKSFGPSANEAQQAGVNAGTVRIDPTALRSSRSIEGPGIDDYDLDDDSEIARVYRQSREDDRQKALEGGGSFVFTLGSETTEKEEVVENKKQEQIVEAEPIARPTSKPAQLDEKEEEKVDVQEPVSFQQQLVNTRPASRNNTTQQRVDPMRQQSQLYQNSTNQAGGSADFIGEIMQKAEFKYKDRNFSLDDNVGESRITRYNPDLPELTPQKGPGDNVANTTTRSSANDYARYIGSMETEATKSIVRVSAGDIFYTRLQIGINTDEISPIRAEILSGELAGAVLLGYPKRAGGKAVIELNTMTFNRKKYAIDAVALDLDTQRTAMADDVDRHYVRNMAYLTIASIVSGYSKSLQNWEETTDRSLDGESIKRQDRLDKFEDRVVVGIGEAGEELKSVFRDQINREPTVYVYPKDIAVMFMDEAIIGDSQ